MLQRMPHDAPKPARLSAALRVASNLGEGMTRSRNILPPRRYWRDDELSVLVRNYPHFPTQQIADQLGRTTKQIYCKAKNIGLRKSDAYLASAEACHLRRGDNVGAQWRFKPGHESWNKGVKGSTGTHPNTRANQFKPGNVPHTRVPVGSYRICGRDGMLEKKYTDLPGRYDLRWFGVHRMVWQLEHGTIPLGRAVVFKPGRAPVLRAGMTQAELARIAATITAGDLECLTRAELMKRNSVHTRYPPGLARLAPKGL